LFRGKAKAEKRNEIGVGRRFLDLGLLEMMTRHGADGAPVGRVDGCSCDDSKTVCSLMMPTKTIGKKGVLFFNKPESNRRAYALESLPAACVDGQY
jgi:hypothetical protein